MAYRTKICDQGGLFNASRPQAYSAETRTFLNDLIKESRLTTIQRKSLQNFLRTGSIQKPSTTSTIAPVSKSKTNIKKYRSTRPRTLKDIIESGAYEPEVFRPNRKQKNFTEEKEKLQSIMEFGKVMKLNPLVVSKKPSTEETSNESTDEELIDTVLSQIEDRELFLSDMELLGEGSKHRASIIHEICDRIKKLEAFVSKVECSYRSTDIQGIANKYREPLGPPKLLPGSLATV